MYSIFTNTDVGRKNVIFGVTLFVIFGVVIGIPLTINLFGGSVLTTAEYQTWKVVHGYGVFLSFINYFFGLLIDRLDLTRRQKEIASWSFLATGLMGGVARMILVLLSALGEYGIYASLGESVFIALGTFIFLQGQIRVQTLRSHDAQLPRRSVRSH